MSALVGKSNSNLFAFVPKFAVLIFSAFQLVSCRTGVGEVAGAPQVPVRVKRVEVKPLTISFDYTVSIEPMQSATVSAEVMAEVKRIAVQEGARVKKGDTILYLNDETFLQQFSQAKNQLELAKAQLASAQSARPENIAQAEASYASAKAGLEIAEREYKRSKHLYEEGVMSKAQLDKAELNYQLALGTYRSAEEALKMARTGARAEDKRSLELQVKLAQDNLRLAQINLNRTRIKAPFSGVVTEIIPDVGDLATPGAPVALVVDDSAFRLTAYLPLEKIAFIKVGDKAKYEVVGSDIEGVGTITLISPSADEESKQYKVEVQVRGQSLPIGSFARVTFENTISSGHVVIPISAVVNLTEGTPFVFTVLNGAAKRMPVKLGSENGVDIEVLSPLKGGELLVVEGQSYLSDGVPVRIVEESGDSSSAESTSSTPEAP